MAGLDFSAKTPKEKEDDAIVAHNSRIGVILFLIYTAFYGGFMILSAFWPEIMSRPVVGGVNLSVVYGLALILVAIIEALLYLKLCRTPAKGGSR
jgi:uncharacterized membrane protein (DUF485 family)